MGKYGTTDSRVANNSLIGNSRMKYNGTDSEYLLVIRLSYCYCWRPTTARDLIKEEETFQTLLDDSG